MKPKIPSPHQESRMSSASRFPRRPILVTIPLPLDAWNLIRACLLRALHDEDRGLVWIQTVHAQQIVERINAELSQLNGARSAK